MEIENLTKNKIIKLKTKKIKCPTCKAKALGHFHPFCSKKCSDIDLMKWLSNENYINLNLEQK